MTGRTTSFKTQWIPPGTMTTKRPLSTLYEYDSKRDEVNGDDNVDLGPEDGEVEFVDFE